MSSNFISNENSGKGEWIPLSLAAKLTPYSAEYLSLLARRKKLPAKKIDNVWYTTKSILQDYMHRQMLRSQIQGGSNDVDIDEERLKKTLYGATGIIRPKDEMPKEFVDGLPAGHKFSLTPLSEAGKFKITEDNSGKSFIDRELSDISKTLNALTSKFESFFKKDNNYIIKSNIVGDRCYPQ